jgi:hypothetical protein
MLINLIVGIAGINLKLFVASAALFSRLALAGNVPVSLALTRHKDAQSWPAGLQRRSAFVGAVPKACKSTSYAGFLRYCSSRGKPRTGKTVCTARKIDRVQPRVVYSNSAENSIAPKTE